ncbi:MAG: DUF937 domain-containing protein [Woeseiaceae bacterium]
MDLMDLLSKAGGGDSVSKLASTLGIGGDDAAGLIGALSPSLISGLQKQVAGDDGIDKLRGALMGGSHSKYIDQPELMGSDETRNDGNKILGHLFGSKDVSRNVAAKAAKDTGLDSGMIKKALPMIAGLAMGALSKKSDGGSKGSGLGGLLGGLVGGGGGMDDLLGLARKFF